MKIPIVNEQDEVIGMEERSIILQKGLICRVVNVWLVTPEKEFIFQKRGPNQETWPGRLDVAVAGHVDFADETYEECAKRELFEETGLIIPLQFLNKVHEEVYEPNKKLHHNAFRGTFFALFEGDLNDLKIEKGHGLGFQKFSLDTLMNMSEEEKQNFIPRFFDEKSIETFKEIISLLFK